MPFLGLRVSQGDSFTRQFLDCSVMQADTPATPGENVWRVVPESVVVLDELEDNLGGLGVDAFGCLQHTEQLRYGDDGMELDSL